MGVLLLCKDAVGVFYCSRRDIVGWSLTDNTTVCKMDQNVMKGNVNTSDVLKWSLTI